LRLTLLEPACAQTLAAAAAEGAGCLRLTLLEPACAQTLAAAALRAEPEALHLVLPSALVTAHLATERHASGLMECPLCHRPFWCQHYPHALSALAGDIDDPSNVAVDGLCAGCCEAATTQADLIATLLTALRRRYRLSLRLLPSVHPVVGHA
jgi:hypothetical protein